MTDPGFTYNEHTVERCRADRCPLYDRAPEPTPAEAAQIERFGIFRRERVLEALRATIDRDIRAVWATQPAEPFNTWQEQQAAEEQMRASARAAGIDVDRC